MIAWRAGLLALAAACLATPAIAADIPPTVTTQAGASSRLPNTRVDTILGIEAQGKTLAEVQSALSAASGTLLPALGAAGARDIGVEDADIRPTLDGDPSPGRTLRITGFTGRIRVSFNAEPGRFGATLGEALTHGATRIDEITLHPRDTEIEAARNRLAADATRAALARARATADATGTHLGAVQSINVTAGTSVRQHVTRIASSGMFSSASASVSTEPGDTEVTVTVNLVVLLGP